MYIYKVVKGERKAVDLLTRMKKISDGKLHWCESFAHADDVTVERIYAMAPDDEWHKEYIIMYMKVDNWREGQRVHGMISQLREWAYEDIRAGRITD